MEQSELQNIPNWNTGTSAICALRIMSTSCPPIMDAEACMVTGMICAYKPALGPVLIVPQTGTGAVVDVAVAQVVPTGSAGVTVYCIQVTPVIAG